MGRLLLIVLGLVSACDRQDATTSSSGASDEAIVFHRGNGFEPDTLDPHRSEETSAAEILRDLFEGLVTEAVDSSLIPGVAESWQISDDGRVYVFRLREDARWSNGDSVVAADFMAGLRRTVDPATASGYAQVLYPVANARAVAEGELAPDALGVRALDDHTLEIRLAAPTPYFLHLLTHPSTFPIHRASFARHGAQFARPGRLVSNGAYRLAEWVVQSHIKLQKNEHYSGSDGVQIDVVYYYPTEDSDAELRRYRAGELDYTYVIPTNQFEWIRENFGDELQVAPYLSVYFYGFDLTEPPFDDIRLRQALSMAIDREVMTRQVTGVGEIAAFSLAPPGVAGYAPYRYAWAELDDAQRLAEARRLYRATGYGPDNPLRTEIRYNTNENHKRIAVAAAAMWRQALGVEARLFNEEFKVMLQTRRDPARWDIMRYGWTGDYNDAYTFIEIFQSDHGQNFTGFEDAEYDRLAQAAVREPSPSERSALMRRAEQRVLEEYAIIPIYFYVTKHLVKPYVKGFQPNILDHNYSRHYRVERN